MKKKSKERAKLCLKEVIHSVNINIFPTPEGLTPIGQYTEKKERNTTRWKICLLGLESQFLKQMVL